MVQELEVFETVFTEIIASSSEHTHFIDRVIEQQKKWLNF